MEWCRAGGLLVYILLDAYHSMYHPGSLRSLIVIDQASTFLSQNLGTVQ